MIEINHRDVLLELPNPGPVGEQAADNDRELAAGGRDLPQRLTWLPALKQSDYFAERFAAVSKQLDEVLAAAETSRSSQRTASEDLQ